MQEPSSDRNSTSFNELEAEEASSRILNELLGATLSREKRVLSQEDWGRLQDATRKLDVPEASLDEFVVMLVESFLVGRFPKEFVSSGALSSMSSSLGQTLCSDPASRKRLAQFRQQIREMNRGD